MSRAFYFVVLRTLLFAFALGCCAATPHLPNVAPASGTVVLDVRGFDSATIDGLIAKLDDVDGQTVWIRIDTYGGSVEGANRLMRRLETMKSEVTCVVDSKAYSAGFYLLESEGCDRRLMTARATLMAHRPLFSQTGGNAAELRQQAAALDAMGDSMIAASAARIGISFEALAAKMAPEWWLSSCAAVEAHAVDGVVSASSIPASTPYDIKPASLFDLLGAP